MAEPLIYHLCRRTEWQAAEAAGLYRGSSQDAPDGCIHFSTGAQLAASAAKHRAGQNDLVLVAVDPAALGDALKWEASRSGALFPHLYGSLPLRNVRWTAPVILGDTGRHLLPALV